MIGRGYSLSLYDQNVTLSRLLGKNKEFLDNHIPHISSLLEDDMKEVFNHAEVIVIGNKSLNKETIDNLLKPKHILIDLVRIDDDRKSNGNYEGICW